jgi:hypothetical protein
MRRRGRGREREGFSTASRTHTPRNGLCEEIGDPSHARRYESAPWPDEVYVSRVVDELVENGDDIRISEIIRKRQLGEPADPYTG